MNTDPLMNIAACLPQMAARQPDTVAIYEPSGQNLTYRELDTESDWIARGLGAVGIDRGVRTVLMVPPGREFFTLAFGMAKAGVVPVVVDPGMPRAALKACLAEAQPEAFIGIPKAHVARMALGWCKETVRARVTVGGLGLFGGSTLEQVKSAGRSMPPTTLAQTRSSEVAAILFTSGSTGRPKGVVYTHGNFAAQIEALRQSSGIQPGEIDLATFAPFALFNPALGMTTVLPEMDFARPAAANPERIVSAIIQFSATNMFCSPALLEVLARYGAAQHVKLPSLRRVVCAGAPVSPRWVEQFVRMLDKGAQVLTPYGATEALPVAVIGSDEILRERAALPSPWATCVGRPVDTVEVAIIPISDDPIAAWTDDLRCAPREVGEIAVRGPMVTQRYWNRDLDTTSAKIPEGPASGFWHRMGDLGYLDEQGRLWFCGRKSQRVRLTSGSTLFTIPCEAVFNAHPQVRRTALVGAQREGCVLPVLCVESEKDIDPARLTAELLQLGAKHPHTAPVKTVLFHPRFPVDTRHNAKIGREALALWAESRLG